MELFLRDVRCFRGPHTIPIRPLTILVGENSSGKSTVLAMLAAISEPDAPFAVDFNREPYELGGFDNIASRDPTTGSPASEFLVGYDIPNRRDSSSTASVRATFSSNGGAPVLSRVEGVSKTGALTLTLYGGRIQGTLTTSADQKEYKIDQAIRSDLFENPSWLIVSLLDRKVAATPERLERLYSLSEELFRGAPRSKSLAPIRSKPQRTHDRLRNEFQPEGSHIPYLLRANLAERTTRDRTALVQSLVLYGRESGLFDNIKIRQLGETSGDPFQLHVETGGLQSNLADVGYGVSQVLPVVVESLITDTWQRIIIQQPEVHLHPKAQAALGSFFARIVSKERKSFVVETHSDYFLDRVRKEVAEGSLKPTDVQILYFERSAGATNIYALSLDAMGNIDNAPTSYRRFFLDEELGLLMRGNRSVPDR